MTQLNLCSGFDFHSEPLFLAPSNCCSNCRCNVYINLYVFKRIHNRRKSCVNHVRQHKKNDIRFCIWTWVQLQIHKTQTRNYDLWITHTCSVRKSNPFHVVQHRANRTVKPSQDEIPLCPHKFNQKRSSSQSNHINKVFSENLILIYYITDIERYSLGIHFTIIFFLLEQFEYWYSFEYLVVIFSLKLLYERHTKTTW